MSTLTSNGPTRYRVMGPRNFRGHATGQVFTATLDRGAEQRAVGRGDIRVVERITPSLQPGSYRLPHGWVQPEEGGK